MLTYVYNDGATMPLRCSSAQSRMTALRIGTNESGLDCANLGEARLHPVAGVFVNALSKLDLEAAMQQMSAAARVIAGDRVVANGKAQVRKLMVGIFGAIIPVSETKTTSHLSASRLSVRNFPRC